MKAKQLKFVNILGVMLLLFMFMFSACDTTKQASKGDTALSNGTNQSLISYLRKEPAVKVVGNEDNARVYINNIQGVSGGGQTEPLFILNGSQIGNSYNQAISMIIGKEIESVKVLKSTVATVQYGERAGNGAIVIRVKSDK